MDSGNAISPVPPNFLEREASARLECRIDAESGRLAVYKRLVLINAEPSSNRVWSVCWASARGAAGQSDDSRQSPSGRIFCNILESRMTKGNLIGVAFLVLIVTRETVSQARAERIPYPAMAPLDQYLIADKESEIALARSAAPPSLSDMAEVMVLSRTGYTTAAKGTNGFLCLVERSWGAATDHPEFWNSKVRSPICFNPQSVRSFVPIYMMKTKLVLAGKSRTEIAKETASALEKKELPGVEPGALCYMMSKRQYLSDQDKNWHPHLMFFVPGKAAKSWGANLKGSPVLAADDPEERVTIMLVPVGTWSDGTSALAMGH